MFFAEEASSVGVNLSYDVKISLDLFSGSMSNRYSKGSLAQLNRLDPVLNFVSIDNLAAQRRVRHVIMNALAQSGHLLQ